VGWELPTLTSRLASFHVRERTQPWLSATASPSSSEVKSSLLIDFIGHQAMLGG